MLSEIQFQRTVQINLPMKINTSDSIYFFPGFTDSALFDIEDCINLPQREPLKIKSVMLLLPDFFLSKVLRGMRVVLFLCSIVKQNNPCYTKACL